MTLLQEIKADQLTARKNRDTIRATVLTTLIGEASAIGKNDGNRISTDEEVSAVIRKFIKNIDESLQALSTQNVPNAREALKQERIILSAYLPQQLTETALVAIIQQIIDNGAAKIGDIMKPLNAEHKGLFDGKMAKAIIEKLLAQ
jgi:uncharacterized protein YqeY